MDLVHDYKKRLDSSWQTVDPSKLTSLIGLIEQTRLDEKPILVLGNGGSMSTASHFALDLNKAANAYSSVQKIRAFSLSDPSAMTAYGNDNGYEKVFSDQIQKVLFDGGLEIVISASGNSPNIIRAVEEARNLSKLRNRKITSFGIFGFDGGSGVGEVDDYILTRTEKGDYRVAEDMHMQICHMVIEHFENPKYKPIIG